MHVRSRHFTRDCALTAADVWRVLGDWRGVPGLPPTQRVRIRSGEPTQAGCEREIGAVDADASQTVSETLTAWSGAGPVFSLAYAFNRPAFGVQRFAATWIVAPAEHAPQSQSASRVSIVCAWEAQTAAQADAMGPFYDKLFGEILDACAALTPADIASIKAKETETAERAEAAVSNKK